METTRSNPFQSYATTKRLREEEPEEARKTRRTDEYEVLDAMECDETARSDESEYPDLKRVREDDSIDELTAKRTKTEFEAFEVEVTPRLSLHQAYEKKADMMRHILLGTLDAINKKRFSPFRLEQLKIIAEDIAYLEQNQLITEHKLFVIKEICADIVRENPEIANYLRESS